MAQISPQDLHKFDEALKNGLQAFSETESQESIGELQQLLDALIVSLREAHQTVVSDRLDHLIACLKEGTCSQNEVSLLREVIVGDAVSYLSAEKAFESWKSSLSDATMLTAALSSSSETSPAAILEAIGRASVLKRTLEDLAFYIERRTRIEMFDRSVADGIDKLESHALRGILEFKIQSKLH